MARKARKGPDILITTGQMRSYFGGALSTETACMLYADNEGPDSYARYVND